MNFKLTEEQRQLQDGLRRLVGDSGRRESLRAVIDGKADWDEALWRDLVAFGVPGIVTPESLSGSGLTMVELALVAEVLGFAGAAVPFLGHALATIAILEGGDEAQKARWLPGLAGGEKIASVALSEGEGVWDPGDWTLAADGSLSGRKLNVPHGARANLLLVGLAGGELGVVEVDPQTAHVRAMEALDRTQGLTAVKFGGASVSILPNGRAAATRMRDAALVLLAADAFGGAARVLEMTADYTLMREQFGAKLAQFQGVKHQMANLALEVEPTRGLYWFAAYAYDNAPARASHAAALAKAHAAEVFLQTARAGTELHGGIGFTWDYDAHIWLKRAMFDYAWAGGPREHFARAADLAGW